MKSLEPLIGRKTLFRSLMKFPPRVWRFTGAHELGHWLLHPNKVVMHRDRPILDLSAKRTVREVEEKEADYFAACYLMPPKLVCAKVRQTFGLKLPIRIDDDIAYWLDPNEPDELSRPRVDSDVRELTLAGAISFQGRHFKSLAEQFHVSQRAMAIRLKELGIFA